MKHVISNILLVLIWQRGTSTYEKSNILLCGNGNIFISIFREFIFWSTVSESNNVYVVYNQLQLMSFFHQSIWFQTVLFAWRLFKLLHAKINMLICTLPTNYILSHDFIIRTLYWYLLKSSLKLFLDQKLEIVESNVNTARWN